MAIWRMKCLLGWRAMSQSPVSRKCLSNLRNSCCREMSVASTIDRTRSANSENWESVRYLGKKVEVGKYLEGTFPGMFEEIIIQYLARPDSMKQAIADLQWWFSNTDRLS